MVRPEQSIEFQLTEANYSKRYGHSLFRENKTRLELKAESK